MTNRARLAIYWAAGCGGCEISILNLHEGLLDVVAMADVVFCPALVDTKRADVEAMPDASIDVTLLNGAMRTDENIEMAHLLRRKSKVLVAFGSCSNSGCVPGLGNLTGVADILRTCTSGPSKDNLEGTVPRPRITVPEGVLELPLLADRVVPLADVVPVDYFIPGCPPEPAAYADALLGVLRTLTTGEGELPPPGTVVGAGPSSVCAECARTRNGKTITTFRRTYEVQADATTCLLEQGLLCMGIATRQGCGALCPAVNMPCIGCYGPPADVLDQGAAMVGALGAALDVAPAIGTGDDGPAAYADSVLDEVPDWTGTLYKFTLAASRVEAVALRHAGADDPA